MAQLDELRALLDEARRDRRDAARFLSYARRWAVIAAGHLDKASQLATQLQDAVWEMRQLRAAGLDAIESEAYLRAAIHETVDEACAREWAKQIKRWEKESDADARELGGASGLICPPEVRRAIIGDYDDKIRGGGFPLRAVGGGS